MKDRFGKFGETGAEVVIDRGNNRTIGDAFGLSHEWSDRFCKFCRGGVVKIVGGEVPRGLHILPRDQPVLDVGVTDVYA